jgi:hypothetical protein
MRFWGWGGIGRGRTRLQSQTLQHPPATLASTASEEWPR